MYSRHIVLIFGSLFFPTKTWRALGACPEPNQGAYSAYLGPERIQNFLHGPKKSLGIDEWHRTGGSKRAGETSSHIVKGNCKGRGNGRR